MNEVHRLSGFVEQAALELAHKHSLDEIEASIASFGVDDVECEKLVLFIPSAFAAEHYSSQGIEFPESYFVGFPGNFTERNYASEPIYQLACTLARRWQSQGRESLVLRVLDWSAEANAIKEAAAKGLTPTRMTAVHHGLRHDA